MNNPNIHLTTLLVILTVTGPCSSCKDSVQDEKTVCTAQNTVYVPKDMKDRFFFKEGSYWIYKNLATSETDSIWVWSSYNDNYPANELDDKDIKDKCYETFTTNAKSIQYQKFDVYNRYGLHPYPKMERILLMRCWSFGTGLN